MNAIDKAREDRSRNLARLRKLTIGTAAIGVAATTGFTYLAAVTYAGTTTTSAAAVSTAAATTASTSSLSTGFFGFAPSVGSSSGFAHVSSGGS